MDDDDDDVMIGMTADHLAEKHGHEDCVKAIDDFFAEQSATSAGHQASTEHTATAVNYPGNFVLLLLTTVSVTDYINIFERMAIILFYS